MDQGLLLQIAIGVAGLLVGLGAGLALRRPDKTLEQRVKTLEGELHEARQRYDRHRSQVEKHFERTSDLFRDLTEQYTQLYSHLAQGARELCPEGGPALGRGLDDPLLAESFGARAAARQEAEQEAQRKAEPEGDPETEPEAEPTPSPKAADDGAEAPEPPADGDLSELSREVLGGEEEKPPEGGSR